MSTAADNRGQQAALQQSKRLTHSGSRHQIVEAVRYGKLCVIRKPMTPAPTADFWREVSIQSLAADHRLAPRILETETSTQTILLERATPEDLSVKQACQILSALHTLPRAAQRLNIEHAFEFWFSQIEPSLAPWDQASNRDRATRARVLFADHRAEHVLCHGDPVPENFMRLDNRNVLIDWEYACLAPFWWDVAIYSSESGFAEVEKVALLTHYSSATVSASQMQTLAKFISVYQDLRELWSIATAARAISYHSNSA